MFSWLVGAIISFISFGIQVQARSGPGQYVTLSAALIGSFILIITLRQEEKDIKPVDWLCLGLSFVSILLWLTAKRPVLAMVFIVLTEVISFLPTVRKSHYKPFSETLSSYVINFFRFIIAILALESYAFVAVGYPATWLTLNGLFAVYLVYRRHQTN